MPEWSEAHARAWYRRVCSPSEIDRILHVQDAGDYLLRLRADTIADHMRLFRVYRNMSMAAGPEWSLEGSFSDEHYRRFLSSVDAGVRSQLESVAYGDVFSTDANGHILATEYGPIVTISAALAHFLEFAHLALVDTPVEVPDHVRVNALRIAVRVMLQAEALDFFMDPRGIVPPEVEHAARLPIPDQLSFVAGHEFAHFILGHLDTAGTSRHSLVAPGGDATESRPEELVLTHSQREELEADLYSVECLQLSPRRHTEVADAALLWFGCLHLYERVRDTMFPGPGDGTHSGAKLRFEHLLDRATAKLDREAWRSFWVSIEWWSEFLVHDVNQQLEVYEVYGSLYLDSPNTVWRGPELIDRVDFY